MPAFGRTASGSSSRASDRFPARGVAGATRLHYNWHRHYDPTLGRYTQPDPLGFVDGPSVYGYAVGSPGMAVDPDGRLVWALPALPAIGGFIIKGVVAGAGLAAGLAIGDLISQMASQGKQADSQIEQDWVRSGVSLKNRCDWLEDNKKRYRPDQVKATEKAWRCRHSRASKDRKDRRNRSLLPLPLVFPGRDETSCQME